MLSRYKMNSWRLRDVMSPKRTSSIFPSNDSARPPSPMMAFGCKEESLFVACPPEEVLAVHVIQTDNAYSISDSVWVFQVEGPFLSPQ